jgi:hypothetical protein
VVEAKLRQYGYLEPGSLFGICDRNLYHRDRRFVVFQEMLQYMEAPLTGEVFTGEHEPTLRVEVE